MTAIVAPEFPEAPATSIVYIMPRGPLTFSYPEFTQVPPCSDDLVYSISIPASITAAVSCDVNQFSCTIDTDNNDLYYLGPIYNLEITATDPITNTSSTLVVPIEF